MDLFSLKIERSNAEEELLLIVIINTLESTENHKFLACAPVVHRFMYLNRTEYYTLQFPSHLLEIGLL